MEVHNPLSITKLESYQDKQDSKMAWSINESYLNKSNTFSYFEEESIGSIQIK